MAVQSSLDFSVDLHIGFLDEVAEEQISIKEIRKGLVNNNAIDLEGLDEVLSRVTTKQYATVIRKELQ